MMVRWHVWCSTSRNGIIGFRSSNFIGECPQKWWSPPRRPTCLFCEEHLTPVIPTLKFLLTNSCKNHFPHWLQTHRLHEWFFGVAGSSFFSPCFFYCVCHNLLNPQDILKLWRLRGVLSVYLFLGRFQVKCIHELLFLQLCAGPSGIGSVALSWCRENPPSPWSILLYQSHLQDSFFMLELLSLGGLVGSVCSKAKMFIC